MKFGFGQALTRKEDAALLRGAGRYVADVAPDATLHAVMLRSPHAHARFVIHVLDRVRAMPGVRLVLTAAEVAGLGPLPTPGRSPVTFPSSSIARFFSPCASAIARKVRARVASWNDGAATWVSVMISSTVRSCSAVSVATALRYTSLAMTWRMIDSE